MEELREELKLFLRKNRDKSPTGWAKIIGIGHVTLLNFLTNKMHTRARSLLLIRKFLEEK